MQPTNLQKPVKNLFSVILLVFTGILTPLKTMAQQEVQIHVSPTINTSIKGHLELDRKKYFSLAGSSQEVIRKIKTDRIHYYFRDSKMTLGRGLGMVYSEVLWGNAFREDANRSGYMDIEFLKSKADPSDAGFDLMKTYLGDNQDLALHDRHSAYPSFMENYTKEDVHGQNYPENNDAAAEVVANFLKYHYTDFQRPAYFELVNEPHWRFWSDQRFYDFHTKAKQKADELNIPTKIGGPCYSVSYFYKKEFGNMNQFVSFIDGTNFELDFYSFHTYDYMRWDADKKDFVGSVTSGLPLESVFDVLGSYTYTKYGEELKYVASEHGGYIPDEDNRNLALDYLSNTYFPGTGFEFEMERRSVDNFIMVNSAIANAFTFMNHPHIVEKSVPFILLESAGWDPYYYSSLLVKEDFDKNSANYAESKLIHYYQFFEGVEGRRVESYSKDADIQQHAFVKDNTLTLILHNQSNTAGELDIKIDEVANNPITGYTIRELKRQEDFRPVLNQEETSSLQTISIAPQGSVVLFATFKRSLEAQKEIEENIYYSEETITSFSGTRSFTVNIPEVKRAKYGILRVALDRDIDVSKEVEIKLNGILLETPVEDCADRIAGEDDYATTKMIKVLGSLLKDENTIEVKFPDGKQGGVGAVLIRAGLLATEIADIDSDKDGVKDGFDNCPNTKEGTLVNENGCPLLTGNTNFVIRTTGESCTGENDGMIDINTKLDLECTAELDGKIYDFTENLEFRNLTAKNYELCISVKGQSEKECYSLELRSAKTLEATTTQTQNKLIVNIEEGTPPFTVFVNSKKVMQTNEFKFTTTTNNGDRVSVTSDLSCEGKLNTNIILFEITLFPNPSTGEAFLDVSGFQGSQLQVSLLDMSGRNIRNSFIADIQNNIITLDYSDVSKGFYLLKTFANGTPVGAQKLILE